MPSEQKQDQSALTNDEMARYDRLIADQDKMQTILSDAEKLLEASDKGKDILLSEDKYGIRGGASLLQVIEFLATMTDITEDMSDALDDAGKRLFFIYLAALENFNRDHLEKK